MAERKIDTKLAISGESEYKQACNNIKNSLANVKSEMALVTAEFGKNDKSIEGLTAKQQVLESRYNAQKRQVDAAKKALETYKAAGLDPTSEAYQKMERDINYAKVALMKTEKELNNNEKELAEAAKEGRHFGDEIDKAGDVAESSGGKFSKLGGIVANVGKGFAVGMAAIGAAVVGGLGYAVSVADDVKGAMNDFEASTGIAEAGAKGFEDSLKNIYNGNYGESFDDIAASMAIVAQSAKDTDPANVEKLTTSALALRDTFEYDIQEQMRAVNMLMDQFGISGEEAFNLIAQGSQNGLNKNGDLLDSINEYSVHFKSLGLDAEEMFNSFANGAESGTFSVDKLGDAFKEFGIRVKDESKGTTEAFKALGLDADTTAKAFAQGGEQAKTALSEVTNRIFAMEDPLAQNQAGVALFGTMWEDLGVEGMKALTNINGEISIATDAMAKINEVKYDTVGEAFTGLGRIMKTSFILPLGQELTPLLSEFATTMTNAAQSSSGDITVMADAFGKGISDMINGLSEKLPEFEAFATKIIMGLADGLVDNLPTIVMAAANIVINLVQGLIDMLPKIVEGAMQIILELGKGLAEALPVLIPKIVEVITFIVGELVNNLPMIIDMALQIIESLAFGLIEALPALIEALPEIILSIVNGLIEGIPKIIESADKILMALIEGLITAIPKLIEAIPQIIMGIVTGLITGIPKIIETAINLIVNLGTGLIQGIPQLVANIPQIITSIVNGFTAQISKIWDIGKNIVSGIWEGITSMASWISEKVKGFFSGIVNGVKGFLGIHSPSTMFADIGGNMAEGVGVGFDNNMDGVSSDMESSLAATSSTSARAAIDALNEGLTNNAELLTSAISTIVVKIGDGLVANNAKFVQQGLDIDKNLSQGLINGIPQLVAAVPQLVTSLLNAYIANYPKFVQQGVDINKKIAEGIAKSITEITIKVPQIVAQFETAFTGYTSRIVAIGESIMRGIGQGITNMSSWLNRLINNYISEMIAAVEDRLEINSPSKVFAGIGYYMAAGLGDGFAKEMQSVEKDIKRAIPTDFDIGGGNHTRRADRAAQSKPQVQVVQNIYTPQYNYAAQQREAAKQFKLIARQV